MLIKVIFLKCCVKTKLNINGNENLKEWKIGPLDV